jgi:hypothetical protein
MKPKTQREAILMHFANGGSLTTIEATKRAYGHCTKLPSRISEYEKEGFEFNREKIVKKSIFGETIIFLRYSLDLKKTPKKVLKLI